MFKKLAIAIALIIIILVGVLAIVPIFFKSEINSSVKEAINENVDAVVNYSDFSLNLFRSFPNFSFAIYELTITGKDHFENDTLMSLGKLFIEVDISSILSDSSIDINSIDIKDVHANIISVNDSLANYNIVSNKSPKDTSSSSSESENYSLQLKEITINNFNLSYLDKSSNTSFSLDNLKLEANASLSEITQNIVVNTSIEKLNFSVDGDKYLADVNTKLNIDAMVSNDSIRGMMVKLNNYLLSLNELSIASNGYANMLPNSEVLVDLKFSTNTPTFESVLSLIPAVYAKDFDKLEASGVLNLSGNVKGRYSEDSIPSFASNLNVRNATFGYSSLPSKIENINIGVSVLSPTHSLNDMQIDVENFHAEIDGMPIDATILVKEIMKDPWVDLDIAGVLNLAHLARLYPMEDIEKMEGIINMDISFEGNASDIENENYDKLAASADFVAKNVKIEASNLLPVDVSATTMDLDVNTQSATLNKLDLKLGKSDISAQGELHNVIGYLFSNGILKGNLDIKSNKLDINELMNLPTEDGTTESTSNAEIDTTKVIRVPENIQFKSKAVFNTIHYDNYTLSNTIGKLNIEDETIYLDNLSTEVFGGDATIRGFYSSKSKENPEANLAYDINNFDIQQIYSQVLMVKSLAPIAKFMKGSFSTDLNITSLLNPDLSPNLNFLKGDGKIRIPYASLDNPPLFDKIQSATNIKGLNNMEIKDVWTVFKVRDGKVEVEPFDLKLNDMVMNISGFNGFDESIDYLIKLKVPSDKFGNASKVANQFLAKAKNPVLNLSTPKNITFHLKAIGTMSNPKVKIVKVSSSEKEEGVKKTVSKEIKKQVDNAKDEVKTNVNKVINDTKQDVKDVVNDTKEETKKKVKGILKGLGGK